MLNYSGDEEGIEEHCELRPGIKLMVLRRLGLAVGRKFISSHSLSGSSRINVIFRSVLNRKAATKYSNMTPELRSFSSSTGNGNGDFDYNCTAENYLQELLGRLEAVEDRVQRGTTVDTEYSVNQVHNIFNFSLFIFY